jgi:hypothetical protein
MRQTKGYTIEQYDILLDLSGTRPPEMSNLPFPVEFVFTSRSMIFFCPGFSKSGVNVVREKTRSRKAEPEFRESWEPSKKSETHNFFLSRFSRDSGIPV